MFYHVFIYHYNVFIDTVYKGHDQIMPQKPEHISRVLNMGVIKSCVLMVQLGEILDIRMCWKACG